MANKKVNNTEAQAEVVAKKNFFQKYKNYLIGGAVVVVAGAGFLAYKSYANKKHEAKAAAEAAAVQGAFYNNMGYMTDTVAINSSISQLEAYAKEFDDTKQGNLAYAMQGVELYKIGKFQEALDVLGKYKDADDAVVSAEVIGLQAACLASLDKAAEAAAKFEAAADRADMASFSAMYLMQAADCYVAAGKNDKAAACYDKIKKNYPESYQAASGQVDAYAESVK